MRLSTPSLPKSAFRCALTVLSLMSRASAISLLALPRAEVLTHPGRHTGQAYLLTGPAAYTYPELAEQLSQALGKPVKYVDVTPAQAKDAMLKMSTPEWIADFVNDLREMESKDLAATVSPDVERVTGRPAAPYTETLRAVLA